MLANGAKLGYNFYSHAREGRDTYILYFREVTPPYNARRTYFFLMILNHTSIKNYIFPGEPSRDFGVIEGSLFCEWISI